MLYVSLLLPKQETIWRCPTFLPPILYFPIPSFYLVMILSKRPPSDKHLELMSLCSWSGSDHAATKGLRTIEAAHVAWHLKQLISKFPGSRKNLGWIGEWSAILIYIYIYIHWYTYLLQLNLCWCWCHFLVTCWWFYLFYVWIREIAWGFKSTAISNFNIFQGECKVATCCRDLRIFSAKKTRKTKTFSGWWFQPISKISVKMELLLK